MLISFAPFLVRAGFRAVNKVALNHCPTKPSVVSPKRLKNRATRVIPAKLVPAEAGSRNPEGI